MAVDDVETTEDAGAPPAHGRAIAGKNGKGPKWLSGPHRDEILVISSVVLVLLGWLSLRKQKSPGLTDGTSAAQAAYLGNSGGVAGFDQAAVQGLQDNLTSQANASAGAFQGLQDLIAKQQTTIDGLVTSVNTIPSKITIPAPVITQAPAPSPSPAPAPSGGGNAGPQYVTVQRGDTLSGIAARYPSASITAATIGALNGIRNLNQIFAGQNLRVY